MMLHANPKLPVRTSQTLPVANPTEPVPIVLNSPPQQYQSAEAYSTLFNLSLKKGQSAFVVVCNFRTPSAPCRYISATYTDPDGTIHSTGTPYGMDLLTGDYLYATMELSSESEDTTYEIIVASVDPTEPAGIYQICALEGPEFVALANLARYDSPTLTSWWQQSQGNNDQLKALYEARIGQGPLVEPFPLDLTQSYVTFLYWGPGIHGVSVSGGPVNYDETPLMRVGQSDLWYLTALSPNNGNYEYWFNVDQPTSFATYGTLYLSNDLQNTITIDPLNPVLAPGGTSKLTMPDAPPQTASIPSNAPAGTVVQGELYSHVLGETRGYSVYVPNACYPMQANCPLLVMFDGEYIVAADDDLPVTTILDNMIAAGDLPPVIMLAINSQVNRSRMLSFNDNFVQFVVEELLPAFHKSYPNVSNNPADVVIGGYSLGGLSATYFAYKHPSLFGNVLSMSGSYWLTGPDLLRDFGVKSPVTNEYLEGGHMQSLFMSEYMPSLSFFLSVGNFESAQASMTTVSRQLRDILLLRGYDVAYNEYPGNHNGTQWGYALVDGLKSFWSVQLPSLASV